MSENSVKNRLPVRHHQQYFEGFSDAQCKCEKPFLFHTSQGVAQDTALL